MSVLERLPPGQIKSLSILGRLRADLLSKVSAFHNLQSLTLQLNGLVPEEIALTSYTALRTLNLSAAKITLDLVPLRLLSQLTSLTVKRQGGGILPNDLLEAIGKSTQLQSLYFETPFEGEVDVLSRLPVLTKTSLVITPSEKSEFEEKMRNPNLKSLRLRIVGEHTAVPSLAFCHRSLESLSIAFGEYEIPDQFLPEHFEGLKELSVEIHRSNDLPLVIPFASILTSLSLTTRLRISSGRFLKLRLLSQLTSLSLSCYFNNVRQSIVHDVAIALPRLDHLSVHAIPTISRVLARKFRHLTMLKSLDVGGVRIGPDFLKMTQSLTLLTSLSISYRSLNPVHRELLKIGRLTGLRELSIRNDSSRRNKTMSFAGLCELVRCLPELFRLSLTEIFGRNSIVDIYEIQKNCPQVIEINYR